MRLVNAISTLGTKNRGVEQKGLLVLSTKMSNSLIEVGFHANSELAAGQTITDEQRLNDPAFINQAGGAMAGAIDAFIKAYP